MEKVSKFIEVVTEACQLYIQRCKDETEPRLPLGAAPAVEKPPKTKPAPKAKPVPVEAPAASAAAQVPPGKPIDIEGLLAKTAQTANTPPAAEPAPAPAVHAAKDEVPERAVIDAALAYQVALAHTFGAANAANMTAAQEPTNQVAWDYMQSKDKSSVAVLTSAERGELVALFKSNTEKLAAPATKKGLV